MDEGNRRWIIRDAAGQIDGPFTTEKILYKIGRGEFGGDEYIALYPNGKWIPISQDPQFYDKLLEILSDDPNEEVKEDTHVLEFTRAYHGEALLKKEERASEAVTDIGPKAEPAPESAGEEGRPKKKKKKRRKPDDIELVDMRPKLVRMVLKRGKWPILVALIGLAIAAVMLMTSGPREERLRLIAPQKNQAQAAPETMKARIHAGVAEFLRDTQEGYQNAQNHFVFVVERSSKNAEVMALLCMTYLQLWPYAYQDSDDSKVISTVVQMSSAVDPGGIHSSTCRAVDLAVRARFQEAKSLVESVLDSRANDSQPPIMFYFLKGYLLEGFNEHGAAIGYLQSAQKLWPQWVLPFVLEAQALGKLERYNEAGNLYRNILRTNPGHTTARVELGILEYKYFNRNDQGQSLLKQALENEDAPKTVLSRGYFGLAEIALKRQDQSGALKYAQKAFSLNSSNSAAKNLVVQLGGVEILKKTKTKCSQLTFEGDQFFRETDYHAAQAHYKAAFECDQNALAALKAAQCLWKLSFSTEAIEWLNRAIKADPKLIEAYVTMADYQAQRYNFLAASRILEAAKRVNSKSHEVYRGFALVEFRRNNGKGAIGFGKKALQLYENDVETLIILSQASMLLKDYKMAFNYSSKAVEIDVNHRKAQIAYAEALAGIQGVDVGLDYLLRLVNNYPLVTEYRLALGKMHLADERFQQAEEIFRQIIKLEEKPKDAYVELAKVLKAQNHADEALDLLLKAAVLDPADAEPLYLAGIILLDLKKPQEASLQFRRVLTINKLYPLVHFQLGRAALQMNDPQAALNFTLEEKRANPNLADAYLLAAEAHMLMNQYQMCANEYQKAIKLRPQQAIMYVRLAQCYRKSGALDAAIAMLNVAATRESGLSEIWKEQGAIYELKGDSQHAIEAYQQYFVLDPDAPDKSQIEERINSLQRGGSP
jgi:tetratricopeptide (TPR) repeat protein